jgi:hypothetical protein
MAKGTRPIKAAVDSEAQRRFENLKMSNNVSFNYYNKEKSPSHFIERQFNFGFLISDTFVLFFFLGGHRIPCDHDENFKKIERGFEPL